MGLWSAASLAKPLTEMAALIRAIRNTPVVGRVHGSMVNRTNTERDKSSVTKALLVRVRAT